MAAKKKIDPIKQREKRAKIVAIGGVVVLLAVAVFEVPKMMKLMNQKPVVPPPSAVAPPNGTSALPGVTAAATGTTAAGELADTDVPPAASDTASCLVRRLRDEGSVPSAGDERRPGGRGSTSTASSGAAASTDGILERAPSMTTIPTTTARPRPPCRRRRRPRRAHPRPPRRLRQARSRDRRRSRSTASRRM